MTVETADLDSDGFDELLVTAPGQIVALKPNEGGGIGSWDARAARHALASVMRRRPEAYHDRCERPTAVRSSSGRLARAPSRSTT